MNERYLRGVEVIQQLSPESLEQFLTSRVAEIAPDFARMAIEFSFGDIYARDTIDFETREIAAIAALASLGYAGPQLRIHVAAALELGMTKGAIVEILMQSAIYGGFPAALNALAQCHDLLADDCVSGGCA
jgi:4-carboxymuconolactone decarboxylase